MGFQEWIPALVLAPGRPGLVCVPVCRAVQSFHRAAVRERKVLVLFLQDPSTAGEVHAGRSGLPRVTLHRRFLGGAESTGYSGGREGMREAKSVLDGLFARLGIVRYPEKCNCERVKSIEHLRFLVHTEEMRVYVTDRTIGQVRNLAKKVEEGGGDDAQEPLVSADGFFRSFCGIFLSPTSTVPTALF